LDFSPSAQTCHQPNHLGEAILVANMSSMITTAAWVPRGFAAPFPSKYNFDEAEFDRIAQLAKLQLDDANEELEEAQDDDEDTKTESKPSSEAKNGVAQSPKSKKEESTEE
jgi:periodic tryptophan protein 1